MFSVAPLSPPLASNLIGIKPLPIAQIVVPGYREPIQLLERLGHARSRTSIFSTSQPEMLVKLFHLNAEDGSRRVEIEGAFRMEIGNYLALAGPETSAAFRGHSPNHFAPLMFVSGREKTTDFGYLAIEFVRGLNLLDWRHRLDGGPGVVEFHALGSWLNVVVGSFRANGIALMDFKLENVILRDPDSLRDDDVPLKIIDMGDLLMGRHNNPHKLKMVAYSTTIGYAEVFENMATLRAGKFLGVDCDLFSLGVALLELATGKAHFPLTDQLRDSIPADALHALTDMHQQHLAEFPHLNGHFLDFAAQLKEGYLYMETFWQLLQLCYAPGLNHSASTFEQQCRVLNEQVLPIGIDFIAEILPEHLRWAAQPIAKATAPRQIRYADIEGIDHDFSSAFAQSQAGGE